MSTRAPILCTDCEHYRGQEIDQCRATANVLKLYPDFVTGKEPRPQYNHIRAQLCREDRTACGPDAGWFEPRKQPQPDGEPF